jgi:hypothetical protein
MKKTYTAIVLAILVLGTAGVVSAAERSSSSSRGTYNPFTFKAAAENPDAKGNEQMKRRLEVQKRLKEHRVKPPKPHPPRSPHKPDRDDDDDNGHGNNDDHDDDSNPGHGGGNHGGGNHGGGDDDDDNGGRDRGGRR